MTGSSPDSARAEGAGATTLVTSRASSAMPSPLSRQTGVALAELDAHPEWATLSRLPLRVRVTIPFSRFKVRNLLALCPGELVLSDWSSTEDVPLIVASAQLSWSEFEVVDQRMAVRITRLA